jgi:uncharacterized membrane protein YfcA
VRSRPHIGAIHGPVLIAVAWALPLAAAANASGDPSTPPVFVLTLLIFFAAALYSSVGHGGASGYLAAMVLVGMAPDSMKPTALSLNILVSGIATVRFALAGAFSWSVFWPFALTAIPFAYAGGLIAAPGYLYKPLVGAVLWYSAWYALRSAPAAGATVYMPPRYGVAFPFGAGLGFLSGLTGVGGGIFLSPLMLLNRWAEPRTISGVAAPFILVNSIAGLAGVFAHQVTLPPALPWWMGAALLGGIIGSEIGSRRLDRANILRVLALVLVVAGFKMILSAWQ